MTLRETNINQLKDTVFDVLIIGAGINGAVTAAALSARGVKVGLIDSRDFAGFTSQHSSNLVWGGIKYLENYEFGLVSQLCKSRNELMRSFPSTVKEIRFLTTVSKEFRYHPLFLWAGSWLYWMFGRGYTKTPNFLSVKKIADQEPLVNLSDSNGGVEYSDAYLHDNDARFVFNFVRSAIKSGCAAANYVKCTGASRNKNNMWYINANDQVTGDDFQIQGKILINATGAFVDAFNDSINIKTKCSHVLSKGIHLIVPRISKKERVLAFFADDGRLFFAIPMANRTCIGTTDTRVNKAETQVTDEDREFVLSNINARLNLSKPLTVDDVIAERCGVRPLAVHKNSTNENDFLQLSRRHFVEVSTKNSQISIFGGKLTDCLNVGDEICDYVENLGVTMPRGKFKWYGEPDSETYMKFKNRAAKLGLYKIFADDTGESVAVRFWRRYAADALPMLERIENDPTLLEVAIEDTGFRKCEIQYLIDNELIVKLEDFLKRRSKIGLILGHQELKQSSGLASVCKQFFGNEADDRMNEYFQ